MFVDKLEKHIIKQELTPHALYMRLKRLCSKTGTGRLNVSQDIHQEWMTGDRDMLSLALVRALKTHGFESTTTSRKLVKAMGDEMGT